MIALKIVSSNLIEVVCAVRDSLHYLSNVALSASRKLNTYHYEYANGRKKVDTTPHATEF
jgi:hypothetical protein